MATQVGAAERSRAYRLRRHFNLTIDEYEHMLARQGGVCAICARPPGKTRLAVDHCHKTGLIRGLLCYGCNRLVGTARDNAARLAAAAEYLLSPPAVLVLGERFGIIGSVKKRRRKPRKKETRTV